MVVLYWVCCWRVVAVTKSTALRQSAKCEYTGMFVGNSGGNKVRCFGEGGGKMGLVKSGVFIGVWKWRPKLMGGWMSGVIFVIVVVGC